MKTNSPILAAMKQAGAALTRDEYLLWHYLGSVPDPIPSEDESEFPEQFQLETLHGTMITDKVQ